MNRIARRIRMIGSALLCISAAIALAGEPTNSYDARWLPHAQVLHRSGQLLEAERFYRALIEAVDDGIAPESELRPALAGLAAIYPRIARPQDAQRITERYFALLTADRRTRASDLLKAANLLADAHSELAQPAKARAVLVTALREAGSGPVDQVVRLRSLVRMATVQRQLGEEEALQATWKRVEEQSKRVLKLIRQRNISAKELPFCTRSLATCYASTGRTAEAIALLRDLNSRQIKAGDTVAQRETLVELSAHYLKARDLESAFDCLTRAIDLERRREPPSPFELGTLEARLAALQRERGMHKQAATHWREAARAHQDVLSLIEARGHASPLRGRCLETLQMANQELGEMKPAADAASKLMDFQIRTLGDAHPATNRTKSALGALYGLLGNYDNAQRLISDAVAFWRTQVPVQALELALALDNLGVVERARGNFEDAQRHTLEALRLRTENLPENDQTLARSYNNLASVLVGQGHYADGIAWYDRALRICLQHVGELDALRASTLLNLAVAYRSQGRLDQAAGFCAESLEIHQRIHGANAYALVDHFNTLSALYRAQGDDAQALEHAKRALALCERHGKEDHPRAATARHHYAALLWQQGSLTEAQQQWRAALAVYRRSGQLTSEALTLNNLGIVAFQRQQFADAAVQFQRAIAIQERSHARPQEHYSTLCNLAMTMRKLGRTDEALPLLEKAIALIEIPRAASSGAERERAEFFSRFASAFDLLVGWNIENGHHDKAFLVAERSRNRTYLDQIELSGVDLLASLEGEQAHSLRRRERQLHNELSALHARALRAAADSAPADQLEVISQEFGRTRAEYVSVWKEIRDASPAYRHILFENQQLRSLAELRREQLGPRNLMLLYHLGVERSHLFLISGGDDPVEVFELELTKAAARTFARQLAVSGRSNNSRTRGLGQVVVSQKGASRQGTSKQPTLEAGSLTRSALSSLVAPYLESLRSQTATATRDLGDPVESQKGELQYDTMTALADVLLPPPARERILDRDLDRLIVVPDGILHQLPFEALVLEVQPDVEYVLDTFPPISYVPSANVLMKLASRQPGRHHPEHLVLSVGNPRYPKTKPERESIEPRDETLQPFLGLAGRLTDLPATEQECSRVAQAFNRSGVTVLLAEQATESATKAALPKHRYVHIAAHGIVDRRYDNLFGSIALTPTPAGSNETGNDKNDGFLSLHEIHSLDLDDCELAVLSACQTNVGPELPLEAGATLAQAFLAAGTRRVVASHWSVDDPSTAELIGAFFEEIAESRNQGETISYAAALQRARRRVRSRQEWSAPYYWAPFVLVGPG